MNITTRHHVRHRRKRLIVAASFIAASAACSHQPPKPATAGSLSEPDVLRLRALDPTPKPAPARQPHHRPAKIGTALHLVRPAPTQGIPAVWLRVAACETNTDWRYGGPGGHTDPGYEQYDGGYSFMPSTYDHYRPASFPRFAWAATPWQQTVVAKRVLRAEGVAAWPRCGPRAGLRMSDAA